MFISHAAACIRLNFSWSPKTDIFFCREIHRICFCAWLELYGNHRFSITLKEHSTHRETNVILWLCWGNNPISNLSEFWWRVLFLKLRCVIVYSLFWWLMLFICFCSQALYIHSPTYMTILPFTSSLFMHAIFCISSSCYSLTISFSIFFYLISSSLESLFSLWHFICVGSFGFYCYASFQTCECERESTKNKKVPANNCKFL